MTNAIPSVRHRPPWVLAAMLLVIAVAASGCTSDRNQPGGEPTGGAPASARVTSLQSLSELRDRFNEDADEVRLVLLLSPT